MRLLNIALALILSLTAIAQREPRAPKYEMRGAWVATAYGIDWPSNTGSSKAAAHKQKADLDTLINRLHRSGFNALFFQVRPMADALYKSSVEPWSQYVSGTRGVAPTYDPLQYCIERCHALGMECHAWINPFRVGKELPSTRFDRKFSSLWMSNTVGRTSMTILNPALDETRSHLCKVCSEIALNYDIDGIVFDDYFYNPEFIPEDFRASDWELYNATASPEQSIGDWRRENINLTIEAVFSTISAIKEGKLRFGVSPQGIAGGNGVYADEGVPLLAPYGVITGDSQYSKIYSDPVSWLRAGTVDYVSPQIYWTTDNPKHPYGGLVSWWNDVAEMYGRHCYASISVARKDKQKPTERLAEAILKAKLNRSTSFNGAPGAVFYSASWILGTKGEGLDKLLHDSIFVTPALVPPMHWRQSINQLTLTNLQREGNTLTWDLCDDSRYVIYAIPDDVDPLDALSPDADGLDASYIIAITYTDHFTLPKRYHSGYNIAVAPYDRYGVEWQPVFID